jgi:U3 small nucleolar ribonucleoprotein protein IMP3
MRELQHHEKKLLRKVDFLQWKSEKNMREIKILRRYMIQNREDYHKYNKIAGLITKLTTKLTALKASDEVRMKVTNALLDKLYTMGLIDTKKSLVKAEKLSASAFCRRRLPVVMVRAKMAENLQEAITFIEQGHVRVGPEVVTDPAFLVIRPMEDFVTWVDSSKIKRAVARYNDKLDDYELLGN